MALALRDVRLNLPGWSQLLERRRQLPERRAVTDGMFVGLSANIPHWGRDDYDALAREGYSRVPLIYAIITAIATSAAEARIRPMVGDPKDREEDDTSPLAELLRQPNRRQGWFSFGMFYHLTMQYSGNCFILKQRNSYGQVVRLRILRTGRMSIEPGPDGEPLRYWHRLDGHDYPIPAADVIHVLRTDPLDDWFGLSPLHVLARSAQVKVEMQKVQWGAFHNGGMVAGIMTVDRDLDDDEPEDYRRQWRRQFTGVQAGGIGVFGSSLKYQQVGMDLDKMAMPDLTHMADVEICGVFQTPPSVVYTLISQTRGASIGSGGAELEDQRKWWENCLNPEMQLLIEGLERGLRDDFPGDWQLEADTSKIRALQDDEDAKHARFRANLAAGGITVDEFRTGIGQDPIGGRAGSVFYLPNHMVAKTAEEINQPQPLPLPPVRVLGAGTLPQEEPPQLRPGDPRAALAVAEQKDSGTPDIQPRVRSSGVMAAFRAIRAAANGMKDQGVMVALVPPAAIAKRIAIVGEETATDIHLTLAFMGNAADFGSPQKLLQVAQTFAESNPALKGQISGIGRFSSGPGVEGKEDPDAFYASVDLPGLPSWREDLIRQIEGTGIEVTKNHGFTPHMTLAYVAKDAPNPLTTLGPIDVTFTKLLVAIGDSQTFFDLAKGIRMRLLESRQATASDRDARTAAYAAALLLLWQRLQSGDLTRQEYDGEVAKLVQMTSDAIIDAVAEREGIDPVQVRQGMTAGQIASLMGKAMLGASAFAAAGSISDAMAAARANMAAGPVWAAEHVAEAGAQGEQTTAVWQCQDDEASCEDCVALNGEEWSVSEIPQFPGDGNSQCGGNCRCTLEYSNEGGSMQFGAEDFTA